MRKVLIGIVNLIKDEKLKEKRSSYFYTNYILIIHCVLNMESQKIIIFSFFLLICTSLSINEIVSPTTYDTHTNTYLKSISQSSPQPPQVLRFPTWVWQGYVSFDPFVDYPVQSISFIFDTLIRYDFNTGELIPSLAKQWVVTNDSKQWIFSLRNDVVFHDGSKFNASIVKYNLDRLINPSHPAYVPEPIPEWQEVPLESVEILDDYLVSINFYDPFPVFGTVYASLLGIVSPTSFQGLERVSRPIGTGPYRFDEDSSNETFHNLTRNPNYFYGIPPFEKIYMDLFYDRNNLKKVLLYEDADLVTYFGPWDDWPDFWNETNDYWEIAYCPENGLYLGWFNHSHPILSNVLVRQAINYALDKEAYTDLTSEDYLLDVNLPSKSIIPSGLPFHDEEIPGYSYNVDKANHLLDQAGYPRGEDGYRFEIEFLAIWNSSKNLEIIRSYLNTVGIRVSIDRPEDWWSRFFSGNFDVFVVGWLVNDPIWMWRFLHTSGDLNFSGYSNPEMDIYTELGKQSPVRQEREYYYKKVQQIAQKDAPYLLLMEAISTGYLIAHPFIPFIRVEANSVIVLNYSWNTDVPSLKLFTNEGNNKKGYEWDFKTYEDVKISTKPIYFPETDTIIGKQTLQTLNVYLSMSYNLNAFFPNRNETGKYFYVDVDHELINYNLRCYYDPYEVEYLSHSQLMLFRYDANKEEWVELNIVSSNPDLRYLEVVLSGDVLIRLSEASIKLTFRYFPFVFLIIGGSVSIATLTTISNLRKVREIKARCGL